MPHNYGVMQEKYAILMTCLFQLILSFDGLANSLVAQVVPAYISFAVRLFIYGEEVTSELVGRYLTSAAMLALMTYTACFVLNAVGYKYAVEVSLFKDNEKILNSFEDGVFIIEQGSGQVAFSSKQFQKLANGLNMTSQ